MTDVFVLRLNRRLWTKVVASAVFVLGWFVFWLLGFGVFEGTFWLPVEFTVGEVLSYLIVLGFFWGPILVVAGVGLPDAVRPVRITVRPDGVVLRTPLLRSRRIGWDAIRRVDALTVRTGVSASQLLVLETATTRAAAVGRPGRAYRRLLVLTRGRPDAQGLAFDTVYYAFRPLDVLAAVRAVAPPTVGTADHTDAMPVPGSTQPW
ncbi:hypothetical protein ACIA8O_25265 [Kitasatospora sp. NPDC051853]|uniref:hypothetical protein n=1 Tax=Kitasatospora sp. NPDC051853 TaxID=3364058 RepID=UPI0037A132D1